MADVSQTQAVPSGGFQRLASRVEEGAASVPSVYVNIQQSMLITGMRLSDYPLHAMCATHDTQEPTLEL